MFKHELGKTAKDKITGFTGVITARVEYLTGCNQYCVQPRELNNGSKIDSHYFDEDCIEVTGEGINQKEVTGKDRGACSPCPSSY